MRWILCIICLQVHIAYARDLTGEYKNSPLHGWFESLKSGNGLCCSFADGQTLGDVDWDIKDDHYRVFLGRWIDVPDRAVIKDPNLYGQAVVWPMYSTYADGHKEISSIRCFIPGSGT